MEIPCLYDGTYSFVATSLAFIYVSLPSSESPFTPTLIFDIDLKEFVTIAAMRSERKIAGCFCLESNSTIRNNSSI